MKKKKALYVCLEESKPSDSDEKQQEMVNLGTVDKNMCFTAHEAKVKSDSDEIITFDELGDAYIELENDFKRLRKSYSSLKKEHACCNSKIDELRKKKDEYIAKLDFDKNTLEKLKVENNSLKGK